MKCLYQVEGGKLRVSMHPGQLRAWNSDRRFVFIIAGAPRQPLPAPCAADWADAGLIGPSV